MKTKVLMIIGALLFGCVMLVPAQNNLTGRIYHNPNIMKGVIDKMLSELNTKLPEAKAKAVAEAEAKKGHKLTPSEVAEIDEQIKKGQEAAAALKKGITTAITLEFKDEKQLVMKTKMKIDEDVLKLAGVGWAKRKALKAALAIAPESEKCSYIVKGNLIILNDDEKDKDTLRLSNDGKYIYGKMDGKTKFTLTRTQ